MSSKIIHLTIALSLILNALAEANISALKKNQLLEAEFSLAQKNKIYFIFQIKDRVIHLKARGIVLKEWEVEKIRSLGNSVPVKPISLRKKRTLFPPKRKDIEPGDKEQTDKLELESLDLKDMPAHYTLSMREGIFISIRPSSKRFIAKLSSIWHSFSWYTLPPLKVVWFSLRKKPFTTVNIVMKNKKDAQELYWAFLEGSECIIY